MSLVHTTLLSGHNSQVSARNINSFSFLSFNYGTMLRFFALSNYHNHLTRVSWVCCVDEIKRHNLEISRFGGVVTTRSRC